ncbi:uncharacterized protein LOC144436172 [Glandiceps talaboti]
MTVVMSSLISEVKKGDIEGVKCLLHQYSTTGDDIVNYQEPDRRETPLFCACARGFLSIVQILLSYKARLDLYTIWGGTPLHAAAENGHENVVRLLLQHGACINAQTHYGDTALHLAAFRGHLNVVKILVEANADVSKRNVKWNRPYEEAGLNNHFQIGKYLSVYGAMEDKRSVSAVPCVPVSVQTSYSPQSPPITPYMNIQPTLNYNGAFRPLSMEYNDLSKNDQDCGRTMEYQSNIQLAEEMYVHRRREPVESTSCGPNANDTFKLKGHYKDGSSAPWITREPVECDAPIADGMHSRREPVESLDPTAELTPPPSNFLGNGDITSGKDVYYLSTEHRQLNRELQIHRDELATVQNTLRQTRHEITCQRSDQLRDRQNLKFIIDKEDRLKFREHDLKCKITDMETKLCR